MLSLPAPLLDGGLGMASRGLAGSVKQVCLDDFGVEKKPSTGTQVGNPTSVGLST